MRTLHTAALAAATAFAAISPVSQAWAQERSASTASTVEVRGVAPARLGLDADDIREVKGTYALSNGKYLEVSGRGQRLYAEIDGEPRSELILVGRNVFIAPDADRIMVFEEDANGQVSDVVIRPRRQLG